jgi:hypothetical protein
MNTLEFFKLDYREFNWLSCELRYFLALSGLTLILANLFLSICCCWLWSFFFCYILINWNFLLCGLIDSLIKFWLLTEAFFRSWNYCLIDFLLIGLGDTLETDIWDILPGDKLSLLLASVLLEVRSTLSRKLEFKFSGLGMSFPFLVTSKLKGFCTSREAPLYLFGTFSWLDVVGSCPKTCLFSFLKCLSALLPSL